MSTFTTKDALDYHQFPRPGKLETLPCKSCKTQLDLSLAYSPGVAKACLAIAENPEDAALYTNRANLVAVVSNGTAVLGLGNIGALAGKPVMEGKGILFKSFADIDVYDINLNVSDPDELISIVKALEPTFGGINLEDIKAPECFYIEEVLKRELSIPIMHDDQHGTAIISGAGLINGAEISGHKIEDMIVVISGAGAAGIASAHFYVSLGVDPANIYMFDSRGLLHTGRTDLNKYKAEFAQKKDKTLAEAMKGAHLFLGLSQKDLVSKDMVKSMAPSPIIFACANPDPEITYPDALAAVPNAIMGTGRSDYPNQVNNVSGFPFIFRGALDVGATEINEAMKVAAAKSLAELAKEPVPQSVCDAYGVKSFEFGIDYVIPKPLDPRIIAWETPAVAQAAMDSGVATRPITDMKAYADSLVKRVEAVQARTADVVASHVK